jgi:hypothetical protein
MGRKSLAIGMWIVAGLALLALPVKARAEVTIPGHPGTSVAPSNTRPAAAHAAHPFSTNRLPSGRLPVSRQPSGRLPAPHRAPLGRHASTAHRLPGAKKSGNRYAVLAAGVELRRPQAFGQRSSLRQAGRRARPTSVIAGRAPPRAGPFAFACGPVPPLPPASPPFLSGFDPTTTVHQTKLPASAVSAASPRPGRGASVVPMGDLRLSALPTERARTRSRVRRMEGAAARIDPPSAGDLT